MSSIVPSIISSSDLYDVKLCDPSYFCDQIYLTPPWWTVHVHIWLPVIGSTKPLEPVTLRGGCWDVWWILVCISPRTHGSSWHNYFAHTLFHSTLTFIGWASSGRDSTHMLFMYTHWVVLSWYWVCAELLFLRIRVLCVHKCVWLVCQSEHVQDRSRGFKWMGSDFFPLVGLFA